MKILYGVCGEGFGHSSRALTIGKYLEKKGHKILVITYGQAYPVLKNKFKIFKVKGLHLIFKKSILGKRETIKYNAKRFPKNIKKYKEFHKIMTEFKPDLCISDMEPIVPILSFWYKIPLISIDNQHRITNLKINIPKKYKKDYRIAREVTNTFVRKADHFIVTSFAKAPIEKKNTTIVPPIIRKDVLKLKPKYKGKILVYLTKKDNSIIKTLTEINEKFAVYGFNIKKKKQNLEFKKRETFLKDLNECKAIIATAGFTLMSEAIYLKKPYLALPLKGQFEQTLNALFLKKAGFGTYTENLTKKETLNFLKNIKKYRKKLKNHKIDQNKLFKVLDKKIK